MELSIEVVEGDAESLPYQDASFDVVMSLIGSMFAPRPEYVASEMIRVCKPGGRIIMGNWTPSGHVGQMFKVIGKHVSPSPHFPSPLLWGDEKTCRERLSSGVSDLRMTALWSRNNKATDGSTQVFAEYIEVIGRRT